MENKWININNEKPKLHKRVLVYVPKEDNIVISNLTKPFLWTDDDGTSFHLETVSHWMKIPKFKK